MSARDTALSTSRASSPTSDEDSRNVLRIQREQYAERIRELHRVPEQITEAYREAWKTFYAWEPQYSQGMLRGLRDATLPQPSAVSFSDFISDSFDLSDLTDAMEEEGDDDSDSLSYQQWFADEQRSVSTLSVAQEVVAGSRRSPFTNFAYAKYEACTPALQNIMHDQDVRILQFIPYADEPGFLRRIKSYARLHAVFAWQHSWYDVDFKLIALDAVWRLRDAELSLETMDKFPVHFFPSVCGQSGLVASMHHRDLIDWGDSVPSAQLSDLRRPQPPYLGRSVDNMTSMFCASMNCIESLCMLHRQRYPLFDLDPTEKHSDLNRARACGPDCFLMASADHFSEGACVTINQEVYEALRLFPNKSNCKLAILCKTTCINVFVHRGLVLPDHNTQNSFLSRDSTSSSELNFCVHPGPCTEVGGCVCARRKQDCQKRCRCQCLLFGCQCNVCGKDCPCLQASRACNPETCQPTKKGKSKKKTKHSCANTAVQAGKSKRLEVKLGSYGLGTYAEKDIAKMTLLGEYVAEIYSPSVGDNIQAIEAWEKAILAQGKVNRHRGLNYLFNPADNNATTTTYDAATVGDPTRYLNHPEMDANTGAKEYAIDGDIKIIFQTLNNQVKAREELLLDYGRDYWQQETISDDEEDPNLQ